MSKRSVNRALKTWAKASAQLFDSSEDEDCTDTNNPQKQMKKQSNPPLWQAAITGPHENENENTSQTTQTSQPSAKTKCNKSCARFFLSDSDEEDDDNTDNPPHTKCKNENDDDDHKNENDGDDHPFNSAKTNYVKNINAYGNGWLPEHYPVDLCQIDVTTDNDKSVVTSPAEKYADATADKTACENNDDHFHDCKNYYDSDDEQIDDQDNPNA